MKYQWPKKSFKNEKIITNTKYFKMSNTEISQTYDIYVGKNVILTNWNGLKQYVRILKNNKQKKCLEIISLNNTYDIHFLTYENIGEGCAVTKIDIEEEDLDNDLNDDEGKYEDDPRTGKGSPFYKKILSN